MSSSHVIEKNCTKCPPTRQRTPSTIPLFEQQRTDEEEGNNVAAMALASANLRTPSEDMVGRHPPRYPTTNNNTNNTNNAISSSKNNNNNDVTRHDEDANDSVSVAESTVSSVATSSVNGIFLNELTGMHYTTPSSTSLHHPQHPQQQLLQHQQQLQLSQQVSTKYRRLVLGLSMCIFLLCVALIATVAVGIKGRNNANNNLVLNNAASSIISASCVSLSSSQESNFLRQNGEYDEDAVVVESNVMGCCIGKAF